MWKDFYDDVVARIDSGELPLSCVPGRFGDRLLICDGKLLLDVAFDESLPVYRECNGTICRMKNRDEIIEIHQKRLPLCDRWIDFVDHLNRIDTSRCNAVPIVAGPPECVGGFEWLMWMPCDTCGGCADNSECCECNGTGRAMYHHDSAMEPVAINQLTVARYFVWHIGRLPGVMFGSEHGWFEGNKFVCRPLGFSFDGGRGCVAPMMGAAQLCEIRW